MRSTTTVALTTRGRAKLPAYTEALQSARRAGTVNAAEVVTVQHLVKTFM